MKVALPLGVVRLAGEELVVRFGNDLTPSQSLDREQQEYLAGHGYLTEAGIGDGVLQYTLGPVPKDGWDLIPMAAAEEKRLGLVPGSICFAVVEVLRHYLPVPRNSNEAVLIQGFATLNEEGEVLIVFGSTAEHPNYQSLTDEAINLLVEEGYSSLTKPNKTSMEKTIDRTPRDMDGLNYEVGQELGMLRVSAGFSDFGGAQVSVEIEVDENAFADR